MVEIKKKEYDSTSLQQFPRHSGILFSLIYFFIFLYFLFFLVFMQGLKMGNYTTNKGIIVDLHHGMIKINSKAKLCNVDGVFVFTK